MGLSLGIPGLDEVLGVLDPGSLLVIQGPSGSGKTVMALQHVHHVASRGGKALFISFLEDSKRLLEYAGRLSLNLEPLMRKDLIQIVSIPVSASEDYLDTLASMLSEKLEDNEVQTVVFDGISAFIPGLSHAKLIEYLRNIVYSVLHGSRALGLITVESSIAGGFPWIGIVADILIELRYEIGLTATYPRMFMRILKTRGMVPESHVLEFTIGRGGIRAYPLKPMKPDILDPRQVYETGARPIDRMLGGLVEGSLALIMGPSGSGKTSILRAIHRGVGDSCYVSLKGIVDSVPRNRCVETLAMWNTTPLQAAYTIAGLAGRISTILVDNMELVYTDYGSDAFHAFIKALYGLRGHTSLVASLNTDVVPPSLTGLAEIYFDYVFRAEYVEQAGVTVRPVKILGGEEA